MRVEGWHRKPIFTDADFGYEATCKACQIRILAQGIFGFGRSGVTEVGTY